MRPETSPLCRSHFRKGPKAALSPFSLCDLDIAQKEVTFCNPKTCSVSAARYQQLEHQQEVVLTRTLNFG